jgi:cell wall-associated NlpC family hydrolase
MLHRKLVIMLSVALTSLAVLSAGPAQAETSAPSAPPGHGHTLRYLAYQYALTQQGKWYCWAGAGPVCYDCSGLVYASYQHEGIQLGRSTYDMLASGELIPISHAEARSGDLAFYGTGHVELFDRADVTFGAHESGSQVGFAQYGPYWYPTAFYRVKGAGRRQPEPAG